MTTRLANKYPHSFGRSTAPNVRRPPKKNSVRAVPAVPPSIGAKKSRGIKIRYCFFFINIYKQMKAREKNQVQKAIRILDSVIIHPRLPCTIQHRSWKEEPMMISTLTRSLIPSMIGINPVICTYFHQDQSTLLFAHHRDYDRMYHVSSSAKKDRPHRKTDQQSREVV